MNYKNIFTLVLALMLSIACYSQISFVPSHYINNNGERVDCFIKDVEWNINPRSFEYQLTLGGEIKSLAINEVQSFQVESSKYERYKVNIDMSKSGIENLSYQKGPEFVEKEVFLKVLLEGEKSLLFYKGDGVSRYFIKSDGEVQQLVYKSYKNEDGDVAENSLYRGQLTVYLGGDELVMKAVNSTFYNEKSLLALFEKYHEINCTECVVYKKDKDYTVNFSIKPGVDISRLGTTTTNWYDGLDLGTRINFSFGLEAEYMLPINKGKWSIFIEPTLIMDKEEGFEYTTHLGSIYADYSYNRVNVPIGIRYYSFLNDDSKLFADIAISYPLYWNSGLRYYKIATGNFESTLADLEFSKILPGVALSLGYAYKNLAVQLKYNGINQDLAGNSPSFKCSYNSLSFVLAYRFQVSSKE